MLKILNIEIVEHTYFQSIDDAFQTHNFDMGSKFLKMFLIWVIILSLSYLELGSTYLFQIDPIEILKGQISKITGDIKSEQIKVLKANSQNLMFSMVIIILSVVLRYITETYRSSTFLTPFRCLCLLRFLFRVHKYTKRNSTLQPTSNLCLKVSLDLLNN